MNNFIKSAIFSTFLAFVFTFLALPSADAQTLGYILKTMEGHKNALQTLKADLTMTEYESALRDETTRSGSVNYLPRPGKDAWVRIDWLKPDETLLVASGKYVLYRRKLNQAIQGNVNASAKQKQTNNTLKFMSMSKKELQDNYKVQYLGKPSVNGVEVWHLKLTPKGADSFKEAELWVDGDGMPIQAMVRKKNKDETTIRLSAILKNKTMNAAIFNPSSFMANDAKIIDG